VNSDRRSPAEPDDTLDRAAGTERLVLSIAEAADALGLSDDLVYDLTERGDLPWLRFGRRKVIPRQAIELVLKHALEHFNPERVAGRLVAVDRDSR